MAMSNLFYRELDRHGLRYVLEGTAFRPIAPEGSKAFVALVRHIIEKNLKVYIDPDCDPDGYFAGLTIKEMFDRLGYSNYIVGSHDVKRHSIRQAYMASILNSGVEAVIVVDSSSNDMELIEYIVSRDVPIAIIDHHRNNYRKKDYPKGAVIINPKLEISDNPIIYSELSAGALCALVGDYTIRNLTGNQMVASKAMYLYGFVTLYSDSCRMDNSYNIAYAKQFQNITNYEAPLLDCFTNQYTHMDRNFCSFNMVPRLNALMRMEKFDMLHKLFYRYEEIDDIEAFIEEIEAHYLASKKLVDMLVSESRIEDYDNICIVYMPDNLPRETQNFTGLVASKIANKYSKTCMCLREVSNMEYHGSVRDPFSRDILSIFKSLCYAEGHNPAFGVQIPKADLQGIITTLQGLGDLFEDSKQKIIVVPWDGRTEDDLVSEMQAMADYNEFGGQGLPKAYGVITVDKTFKIFNKYSVISVYGKGHKFTCFVPTVTVGDRLLVSPVLSGSSYNLIVNTVDYS